MPTDAELGRLIEHYNRGRIEAALAEANRLYKKYSDDASLNNMLGVLQARLGRTKEALALYDKALALRPHYAEALNNRGNVLSRLGRQQEAIESFKHALAIYPGYAAAHNNLGNVLYSSGRIREALRSYREALQLQPRYAEALAGSGKALSRLGQQREAIENLRGAIGLRADVADWHNELGNALSDIGCVEEAIACYRDALAVEPSLAEVYGNLGNAQRDLGRFDEARASFESALRLNGRLAEAHYNLCHLKTFRDGDPQLRQLQELDDDPDLGDNARCYVNFALGKAYEDIGDIDNSFARLATGNRLRKQLLEYDIARDREQMEQIRAVFAATGSSLSAPRSNENAIRPIFVVGMPRSGTTLVEQILASHSRVHGAGELWVANRIIMPMFDRHAADTATGFSAAEYEKINEEYLRELDLLARDGDVVTDKEPTNFRWLGFLLGALPGARVIDVRRNPVATCWSIYKRVLAPLGYSNDLLDIAEYYRMYCDLMNLWRDAFPGRILRLEYEELTENQVGKTRDLLEFCALPWEDACVDFHETERPVATMSAGQVRKSMYTGSSVAWRSFESHLEPLISALERN